MAGPEHVIASDNAGELQAAADLLLDHLRGREYPIGVDHYLRVHRLLASLAGCGQLPRRTQDLELWIRPLICESPRDQERFAKDFEEWLRTGFDAVPDHLPLQEPVKETLREVKRGWRRWLILGGVGVLGVAASVGIWLAGRPGIMPKTQLEVSGRTGPRVKPQPPVSERTQAGVKPPTQHPIADRIGYGIGVALVWIFVLVVIVILAAIVFGIPALLWRRSKAKAFLIQRETKDAASSTSLAMTAVDPPIYNSRLLGRAAQGFGIYRRLPSEDLNVPASVAATAREAGRFTPVLAERPAVPEHLVLIDRGSTADLFARFAAGIVQRLEDSNVAVDQFYFDRNPRQCYATRGYRPVTLRELTESFAEHRLLVFSDGAGFLSPVANEYAPWMQIFANWETKTLLTPNPRPYWGVRESIIAQAGWTVIPAEQEELAALAHEVEPEKAGEGFVPGLLGSITARERELLRRTAPEAGELQDLLTDLRVSLGSVGFQWLCACAAYPAIDWTVTLYLGANLRDDRGLQLLRETTFLALARLPWFRYGSMPEWLRLALLSNLSSERLKQVRQALQVLLVSGEAGQVDAYRLEVYNDLRRPLTWFTRQLIRRRLPKMDEDDPLRDRVFVEFLSGANPAALPLPERIASLFRGGTEGQGLGRPEPVWKLIALALLLQIASQSTHTVVSLPVSGLSGLAMLVGGLLAANWQPGTHSSNAGAQPREARTVMAGCVLLFGASIVNAFSGDYVSFGMTRIGFGLLWPGMAVLISRASGPDPRQLLSALALWSATAYVPDLLPNFHVWARLITAGIGGLLLWNVSSLKTELRVTPQLLIALVIALAAAVVVAVLRFVPAGTMPLALLIACLWASLVAWALPPMLLWRRVVPSWTFYLTGLVYWTTAVAGLNLLLPQKSFGGRNVPIVLTALILSWLWQKRFLSEWSVPALTYSFALLAAGFAIGGATASLAITGVLIAACGQPVADTIGVRFPLRSAPLAAAAPAVALWLALAQLGNSLWLELPIPKKLPQGPSLAVCCAVALIAALVVRGFGRPVSPEAVRISAPAASEASGRARTIAVLSYLFWGIPGLIIPTYRQNAFVRFHAVQAAVLSGTFFVFSIVVVMSGLLEPGVAGIVRSLEAATYIACWSVMTIQAARGKMTRLPLIGRLAAPVLTRVVPAASGAAGKTLEKPAEAVGVSSKSEYIAELRAIATQARGASAEELNALAKRVADLDRMIAPSGRDAEVLSALGDTYGDLNDLASAIQAYESALTQPDVQIKTMEQLANVLDRRARQLDSDPNQKTEAARLWDRAEKLLTNLIGTLGPSAERYALLGALWKRRGDFEKAARYYGEGYRLQRSTLGVIDTYLGTNWLQLAYLSGTVDESMKDVVNECMKEAARPKTAPDFWGRVAIADVLLTKHLIDGDLDARVDETVATYESALQHATASQRDAVCGQFHFIQRAAKSPSAALQHIIDRVCLIQGQSSAS